jgi:hypothetical protein
MPKEIIVYQGWVGAREIDRIELEAIGVEIRSEWNPIGAFDRVSMTVPVYHKFVEHWAGRYAWGLVQRKEIAYSKKELEQIASDEEIPF